MARGWNLRTNYHAKRQYIVTVTIHTCLRCLRTQISNKTMSHGIEKKQREINQRGLPQWSLCYCSAEIKQNNPLITKNWIEIFYSHLWIFPRAKHAKAYFWWSVGQRFDSSHWFYMISEILNDNLGFKVKFIYSEKATKFCEISTLLLSVCTVVKQRFRKILWPFQNIRTLIILTKFDQSEKKTLFCLYR